MTRHIAVVVGEIGMRCSKPGVIVRFTIEACAAIFRPPWAVEVHFMTNGNFESDFRTGVGRAVNDEGNPCTFVASSHLPTQTASRTVLGLQGRTTTDVAKELATEFLAQLDERKARDSEPSSRLVENRLSRAARPTVSGYLPYQWTHRESNPDPQTASLTSSLWTMSPILFSGPPGSRTPIAWLQARRPTIGRAAPVVGSVGLVTS